MRRHVGGDARQLDQQHGLAAVERAEPAFQLLRSRQADPLLKHARAREGSGDDGGVAGKVGGQHIIERGPLPRGRLTERRTCREDTHSGDRCEPPRDWNQGKDYTRPGGRRGQRARSPHARASSAVESLARAVAVSRSVLADRFAEVVGQPPMQYLAMWRMQLASRCLLGGDAVSEVASAVGYESEAAFSRAFKKLV